MSCEDIPHRASGEHPRGRRRRRARDPRALKIRLGLAALHSPRPARPRKSCENILRRALSFSFLLALLRGWCAGVEAAEVVEVVGLKKIESKR
jgi:hypothetical protein